MEPTWELVKWFMEGTKDVSTVLWTIVGLFVIWYGKALVKLTVAYIENAASKLQAEADHIKNKEARELTQAIIQTAENELEKAVGRVEQEFANYYRSTSQDCKLTDEQKAELFIKAKELGLSALGDTGIEMLKGAVGDLDHFISNTIENSVNKLKMLRFQSNANSAVTNSNNEPCV